MKIMIKYVFVVMAVFSAYGCTQQEATQSFTQFLQQYDKANARFHSRLSPMDYQQYFQTIPSMDSLLIQQHFYQQMQQQFIKYDKNELPQAQLVLYDAIAFDLETNLRRIKLQSGFHTNWGLLGLPTDGIHSFPFAVDWYRFRIAELSGLRNIRLEDIFTSANLQINDCKQEQLSLLKEFHYDQLVDLNREFDKQNFLLKDSTDQWRYATLKNETILSRMPSYFSGRKYPNFNLTTVFEKPLSYQQLDTYWLGQQVPGKQYYQLNAYKLPYPALAHEQQRGLLDGWAAFCEGMGPDLGLQHEPISRFYCLNARIRRNAKLVVDLGVNYFQWKEEMIAHFWKNALPQDPDGWKEEVAKVTKKPAVNVIPALVEIHLMQMREEFMAKEDVPSYKRYNDHILKLGPLPLAVIQAHILD